MKRTVKEWLELLSEPYRKKALNNLNKDAKGNFVGSLSVALSLAFAWEDSSEGYDYWYDTYSDIRKAEIQGLDFDKTLAQINLDETEKEFMQELEDYAEEHNLGYKESIDKLSYELDFEFIKEMAERMEKNKAKYPAYQWWHKEMDMEQMINGLKRHSFNVFIGEFEDNGNEYGHLIALACNAMMIYRQFKNFRK